MATLITKNSSTAAAVPGTGDLVQGELAVNVTDKKVYTKDSGGNIVKVVGSLGNQEANAVAITGGTISGVAGIVATSYQEFTSSGTWTKPAGANFVYVEAIGGGGSGRRDQSSSQGGGGGGGLFVSKVFRASDIGATVSVTVGAGGAAKSGSNQNGDTGGNSTFGSHLTAYGGGGGTSGTTGGLAGGLFGPSGALRYASEVAGYFAGAGALGDFDVGGSSVYGGAGGGGWDAVAVLGTNGGTSLYGGNGGNGGTTGTAGAVPGGGGGAGNNTSGAGGAGRVRVWTW